MARDQRQPVNSDGQVSAADLRAMAEQATAFGGTMPGSGGYILTPWGLAGAESPDATGPAGGDLSGYYPDPTVVGLQGRSVADGTPSDGQVLTWDGDASEWVPADAVPSSGAITVKESDGSPSYTSITSLEIDQAQGGVVTQPAAGRAKLSWADATTSQVGVVNYGSQTFGGAKTFEGTVRHENIVYTSIGSNSVQSSNWLTRFESQRTSSTGSWNMVWTAEAIGGLMAFTGDVGVMTLSTTPSPSDPADSVTVVLDITAHANFTDDVAFSLNGVQGGSNVTAGLTFTGGLYMSGSFDGPTSIAGSGGTTGLTISGGPITSGAGTLTLGGTLVPANGGTGLTTTPADGALLTGTGSGYLQASAVTHSLRWGID